MMRSPLRMVCGREPRHDAWKAYMRRQMGVIIWSSELPPAQRKELGLREAHAVRVFAAKSAIAIPMPRSSSVIAEMTSSTCAFS